MGGNPARPHIRFGSDPTPRASLEGVRERKVERMVYEAPEVTDFGSIVDHTFTVPSGTVKGCQTNCHLDKFTEQSANPAS
jgi:hypothetical protein